MRCKQNKKIKIKIHKIEKSYSKDDDQVDYKKNNDSNNHNDFTIKVIIVVITNEGKHDGSNYNISKNHNSNNSDDNNIMTFITTRVMKIRMLVRRMLRIALKKQI